MLRDLLEQRRDARVARRKDVRQLAGHGEGVEIGAGIERRRLVEAPRSICRGRATAAWRSSPPSTMRPFSARVDLQMRAADVEAGDDALSFSHASGFHDKGGQMCRKSVAYHSRSRLERRRGGPRRAGAARPLPADRDAAQRELRCRRRRRGPAHALSFPDLLHRRSGRHRRPCAERGGAVAAESHAARRRNSGWMPASPTREALAAALAEPLAAPGAGLRIAAGRRIAAAVSRPSRPHPVARFLRRRVSRPAVHPRRARDSGRKG